jgi:hypothetical protein
VPGLPFASATATRDASVALTYIAAMRLPQVQSARAVLFIAAAITIVTWLIVLWPGSDTRRLPVDPAKPAEPADEGPVYVDINMGAKPQPQPASPAP